MVTILRGIFREQDTDPHVALREALLGGRLIPPPAIEPVPVAASGPVGELEEVLRRQLTAQGLALVQLDEPLASDRMIEVGARLGEIMPETDPAVQPNVESDVILHLISTDHDTADVSRQPFATTALSLHTEGSGRPAGGQPRYIILMCLDAGDEENAAQTVVVPFSAVEQRLGQSDRRLLAAVSYDRPDVPTILRTVGERAVFSFRDFQGAELRWRNEAPEADTAAVRRALVALLEAMYASDSARGLQWRRGALAVIDNTWVFHGRTAAPYRSSTRHRHLKRLRIAPAATAATR